jgi:hypothetical protein
VVEAYPTRIVRWVLLDAFIPENGQSVLDLIPPEVGAYFRDVAREHGDGWRLCGGESQLDLWRSKPGEHVISCARPCDFTLRCFEEPVRLLTNVACAWALRCFTGHSNCGSIRANRARVRASRRSPFFRLSPISRTLRRNSSFVARVFPGRPARDIEDNLLLRNPRANWLTDTEIFSGDSKHSSANRRTIFFSMS